MLWVLGGAVSGQESLRLPGGGRKGEALFYPGVHFLWAVDFHMGDEGEWKGDVEVLDGWRVGAMACWFGLLGHESKEHNVEGGYEWTVNDKKLSKINRLHLRLTSA